MYKWQVFKCHFETQEKTFFLTFQNLFLFFRICSFLYGDNTILKKSQPTILIIFMRFIFTYFFYCVVSSWVKNSYYMSTYVQIFRISKIGMKQTYLILFLIIFNNLHSDWFMVTSSWNKILLSSDLSKWQFLSSNQLCCLHFTKSLHECIYWHASAFFDASS